MERFLGKTVYEGVAVGRTLVLAKIENQVKREKIDNVNTEIARFYDAKEQVKNELSKLYEKVLKEVGKASAAIYESYKMILDDEDYVNAVLKIIRNEMVNAEYAVDVSGQSFSQMFLNMDDDYMKARAADVNDISSHMIRVLSGGNSYYAFDEPSIVVADELSLSDIVRFDREKVLALVIANGSVNSHASILARMMSIPTLIGVNYELKNLQSGMMSIVDGALGEFIIDPDDKTLKEAENTIENSLKKVRLLQEMKGQKAVTKSGREIELYANLGKVSDISYVLENDAAGIGLFRSEFLYLGRTDFPTEEEQFDAYKQVLLAMEGKKVIIRTMDIGADKRMDYFNFGKEDNPALGYRAIRICLTEQEIFKTQLRALLRAACYGNLAVMYPMIISTDEVEQIFEIVKSVKKELDEEKIPYKIPEQGIMIETPAAVMISDKLAKMADFLSIGTNDLTQYTLAIDRQNARLDSFYEPYHEAIFRMIKMVVQNAHKEGKRVGICGELGSDTSITARLIEMDIDELSVLPSMILPIRKIIRELP